MDIIVHLSQRNENSSEIPAHGIYRSVKKISKLIELLEISIMMRSWNYQEIMYLAILSLPLIQVGQLSATCKSMG